MIVVFAAMMSAPMSSMGHPADTDSSRPVRAGRGENTALSACIRDLVQYSHVPKASSSVIPSRAAKMSSLCVAAAPNNAFSSSSLTDISNRGTIHLGKSVVRSTVRTCVRGQESMSLLHALDVVYNFLFLLCACFYGAGVGLELWK